MKNYQFPLLSANDIECRIGTVTDKGVSLLLYKDARVDMRLLDSVVGQFNWQRDHKELKENIYCGVSIYDDERHIWVTKWDCGKESNTEKEKGEASDSFKRACFCWGIGRELYTAPFIWVTGATKNDRFEVKEIDYNKDREISKLVILNSKTGVIAYTFGVAYDKKDTQQKESTYTSKGTIEVKDIKVGDTFGQPKNEITSEHFIQLSAIRAGKSAEERAKFDKALMKMCGTSDLKEISDEQAVEIINKLSASK